MERPADDVGFIDGERLREIRSQTDWQALFFGLGLVKDDSRSTETDWWAPSPFMMHQRPSFHLQSDGRWYDFGIRKGGGVIELVQRIFQVNCYEAGRIILENGWTKSEQKFSEPSSPESENPKHNPPIRQNLCSALSEQGTHPVFQAKGISASTCEDLGIGYLAQGRNILKDSIVFQVRGISADGNPNVLSHIGWKPENSQHPWIKYETFDPSLELYNLDRLLTDPEAKRQVEEQQSVILLFDPWDVAKSHEAGLRNIVSLLNAELSQNQIEKLRQIQNQLQPEQLLVWFHRDEASQSNQQATLDLLNASRLKASGFDWEQSFQNPKGHDPISIPKTLQSACDLSVQQWQWLRKQKLV